MERSKREPDPTSEELLANAPLILNEVDKAPIFDEQTGLPKREFPMFSRKGNYFSRTNRGFILLRALPFERNELLSSTLYHNAL